MLTWWREILSGSEPVGLAWPVLLGFIRISTNPRAAAVRPARIDDAIERVRSWMGAPAAEMIWPGVRHADILFGLLSKTGATGNLTSDAHIAALAIEHNANVATADYDFARFPDVRWFIPGETHP
jgi:hypothetical protein